MKYKNKIGQMLRTFFEDYTRGMDKLFLSSAAFANFAQSIGTPSENFMISTARVTYSSITKKILFEMNPEFIRPLSDGEVAAVIAHETYHVLLGHFDDMTDTHYSNRKALVEAHECIINDALFSNVGYSLPPGMCYGTEMFNQDFSWFTTRNGYDFITNFLKNQNDETEPNENEDSKSQSSENSTNSVSGGSSGSSSGSSEVPNDEKQSEDESSKSKNDLDNTDSEASGNSINSEKSDVSEDSDSKDDDQTNPSDDSENEENSANDSNSDVSEDDNEKDTSLEGEESETEDSESENDETSNDKEPTACGGVILNEDDLQGFKDAVSDAINSAVNATSASNVPDELSDMIAEIADLDGMSVKGSGWSVGEVDKSGIFATVAQDSIDINWIELLAKINPKIKSSGKPKTRDSWHQPRRKMLNSYPEIVLPTKRRLDDSKNKGDSIPTFILALDMSGSIPSYLIAKLASMADSIPNDIIRPYPITWSDDVLPFDTETRQIVKRRGTNIDMVYRYADEVERETKTKPYVLVITDGDCNFLQDSYYYRNRGVAVDRDKVEQRWFWMGIDKKSEKLIHRNFSRYLKSDSVYAVQDFL